MIKRWRWNFVVVPQIPKSIIKLIVPSVVAKDSYTCPPCGSAMIFVGLSRNSSLEP